MLCCSASGHVGGVCHTSIAEIQVVYVYLNDGTITCGAMRYLAVKSDLRSDPKPGTEPEVLIPKSHPEPEPRVGTKNMHLNPDLTHRRYLLDNSIRHVN
jgi:hypothetical protein